MENTKLNEIEKLNEKLADLMLQNQELKQINDELKSNNADLNEFIKLKGLESEFMNFINN